MRGMQRTVVSHRLPERIVPVRRLISLWNLKHGIEWILLALPVQMPRDELLVLRLQNINQSSEKSVSPKQQSVL